MRTALVKNNKSKYETIKDRVMNMSFGDLRELFDIEDINEEELNNSFINLLSSLDEEKDQTEGVEDQLILLKEAYNRFLSLIPTDNLIYGDDIETDEENIYHEKNNKIVRNIKEVKENNEILNSNVNYIIKPRELNKGINMNAYYKRDNELNPLYIDHNITLINIDSIYRNSVEETSTSFMYSLPEVLKNVLSIDLVSAEIPNTWYSLNNSLRNNEFYITVYNYVDTSGNKISQSKKHRIEIPSGNYSATQIQTYLMKYFNNVKGGLQYLHFDFDTTTGKSIFRTKDANDVIFSTESYKPYLTDDNSFYFELDFDLENKADKRELYENFGWYLGFRKDIYKVTYDDSKVDYFKYDNIVTLRGYIESESTFASTFKKYIFLEMNDYKKNFKHNVLSKSKFNNFLGDNILARFQVSSGSYTVINTNSSDNIIKRRKYYGPVDIDRFYIRLLDNNGNVIDLNDNNFSFTLQVTQSY